MSADEGPVPVARVGRSATMVIAAHVAFLLTFVAGAVITLVTFAHNGNNSVSCLGSVGSCGHHSSYLLGGTLLAVGFVGNVVTIAVASRLAIGYGLGAFKYAQRRRMMMQPPTPPGSPTGLPL